MQYTLSDFPGALYLIIILKMSDIQRQYIAYFLAHGVTQEKYHLPHRLGRQIEQQDFLLVPDEHRIAHQGMTTHRSECLDLQQGKYVDVIVRITFRSERDIVFLL